MLCFTVLLLLATSLKCSISQLNETRRVFVIARHNEDANWLGPIASETIVYNKGNDFGPTSKLAQELKAVIRLPNVGRESHTYLQYVIDNYDNLPNVITFSQACICDHGIKEPLAHLLRLSNEAEKFGYSQNFANGRISRNFGPVVWNSAYYRSVHGRETFGPWMDKTLGGYRASPIRIYYCGIFALKKEFILKKPLSFYQNLLKTLSHHNNPIEGHFFERTWSIIFNLQ